MTKEKKELEKIIQELTDYIHSLGLNTEKRVKLIGKIENYKKKLITHLEEKIGKEGENEKIKKEQ